MWNPKLLSLSVYHRRPVGGLNCVQLRSLAFYRGQDHAGVCLLSPQCSPSLNLPATPAAKRSLLFKTVHHHGPGHVCLTCCRGSRSSFSCSALELSSPRQHNCDAPHVDNGPTMSRSPAPSRPYIHPQSPFLIPPVSSGWRGRHPPHPNVVGVHLRR